MKKMSLEVGDSMNQRIGTTDDLSPTLTQKAQPVGTILQLADGTIQACDPIAANLLGHTIEQLTGKTSFNQPWQTIHRDGSPFVPDDYPDVVAVRTGKPCHNVSIGFYQPSGDLIWLEVNATPLFQSSSPDPYASIVTLREAGDQDTEPIRSEPIRSRLDCFQSMVEHASEQIALLTEDCRFFYVNEAFCQNHGYTRDEMRSLHGYDVNVEGSLEEFKQLWNAAQHQPSIRLDVQHKNKSGEKFDLDVTLKFFQFDGQAFLCGFGRDITHIKQAELEREQLLAEAQAARAEAEAANRSKDEFVAIVAHELRSPLNSIAGWAKLLQIRKFDEEKTTKALDTIWRNTQTQMQLVEDLLDISRMVKGNLQLTTAPVNLAAVAEAAVNLVLPQAQAKQIQIELQLPQTAKVSGDFNRLQQVIVNLLTNAIKFTPEQGHIEVQVKSLEEQVQLSVRDTGKGISPEFLHQIFERFQQGQKNTGSKDGLGLGLAIVKNLVELHHGTITVESEGVGKGATFTIQLPSINTPAVQPEPMPIAQRINPLSRVRILVADDEPDMLSLIAFVLEETGAEVRAVQSGAAALECLEEFKPDILISDISMPEGDGYELIQQVRSRLETIPAIALTAYASATHEERSLQAGFQQHFTKPFESESLITAIINLIDLGQPR
jgi:PAS domain S-box-containing protein